ncbi:PQQ-binding-like beta-propeller repeat protein [Natrinema sp. 74]|uniref:PQQ-binding-like beta-propeller repeat protein n=1 Tax=Natrinema sp. 74 TaxID=3384159 RepID=UPI0038D45F76
MPSRRQLLAGTGFAGIGLIGGHAATADRSGTATLDWPMARYDAAGTSYNPDASGPTDDPQIEWEGELEQTGGFELDPPVVVDETVYAGNETLVAFDAATGDVRFSYGNHGGVYRSSPARASASIYRTETLVITSPDGVVGLNAGGGLCLFGHRFGDERWQRPSETAELSVFGPSKTPPPVAVDGTVYSVVPNTSGIVALEGDNGDERWRTDIEHDSRSGVTLTRPAVRDGTVFATGWPSQVRAIDAETGDVLWRDDHDDATILPPTATELGVVVPTRSGVTLYGTDGDVRWTRTLDGNMTDGAAAVADGRVFVINGKTSLHALDLETGDDDWSVPFNHEATPIVADGIVYVTNGVELIAFDAETGEQRFTYEAEWYLSPPAIGDGVLYIVDGDRVLALEDRA